VTTLVQHTERQMGLFWSKLSGCNAWLLLCALSSGASVPLYAFKTDSTIASFGGTSSPTARFWVEVVASGDLLCAALCMQAFSSLRGADKAAAARLVGLYNLTHMIAFLHSHMTHEPHPRGGAVYIISIIIGSFFSLYWGWMRPPVDDAAPARAAKE
jgi:hypothetical protein